MTDEQPIAASGWGPGDEDCLRMEGWTLTDAVVLSRRSLGEAGSCCKKHPQRQVWCTREQGHTGCHVAGIKRGLMVWGVWPNEADDFFTLLEGAGQ